MVYNLWYIQAISQEYIREFKTTILVITVVIMNVSSIYTQTVFMCVCIDKMEIITLFVIIKISV